MMFWYDHNMGGWGYAGMAIGMVLFWILIIVGIIALVRFTSGTSPAPEAPQVLPYGETPEQVLAARFARGEIDEAEYQHRLGVLRSHSRQ
ncbi:SHOCT domain-containing protein [Mycobacterium sp. CVI_P3]|uniref:SHOCT domain-containing protein n=1 Tax=Mycobacterium pinniadriaticum TaxID=2994102 RepID=A0ABT3S8P1_9MYCO|nr:SHOCT domain-containing protein [Mycobacterium pinniadriaticum]MCX2929093.1 SHOCT domain-containing protein [Mycobacterium pinniadriaticum]MCX2935518.1 SHOCT domain-containing protein [Mycobacterium pinniadriaticum]